MVIEGAGADPERDFTSAEQEQLTRLLIRLTEQINRSDWAGAYDLETIKGLHLQIFQGVRQHAGRFRSRDYGEQFLTFGPNRSAAGEDVGAALDEHFLKVRNLFAQLDAGSHTDSIVEDVIHAAAWAHADLIRIHPFRDGNGRVSRLMMNYVFRRYGFPLPVLSIPKQEYFDALNHFYLTREIEPLCELLLRVFHDQLLY